jgi:hypothetical protein
VGHFFRVPSRTATAIFFFSFAAYCWTSGSARMEEGRVGSGSVHSKSPPPSKSATSSSTAKLPKKEKERDLKGEGTVFAGVLTNHCRASENRR